MIDNPEGKTIIANDFPQKGSPGGGQQMLNSALSLTVIRGIYQ